MSTTLGRPPVRSGSARHSFWNWWIDRKTRWVRDAEKQMPDGLFRALAAGTGSPADPPALDVPVSQREGRRRPFSRGVPGRRATVRPHLHAPRKPDDRAPRARSVPPGGPARHREGPRRGRDRAHDRVPHLFLRNGRDLGVPPSPGPVGRRRSRREYLRLHGRSCAVWRSSGSARSSATRATSRPSKPRSTRTRRSRPSFSSRPRTRRSASRTSRRSRA